MPTQPQPPKTASNDLSKNPPLGVLRPEAVQGWAAQNMPDWKPNEEQAKFIPWNPAGVKPGAVTPFAAPQQTVAQLPRSLAISLNQQGWNLPVAKEAKVQEDPKKKNPNITPLADYEYKLDEDEWNRLKEQYGYEADTREPVTVKAEAVRAVKMSQADYDALTEDQRNAVDFNTLLMEAREKDLANVAELSEEDQKAYHQKVERIFGVGKGAERYAPETMKLLETVLNRGDNQNIETKLLGQDLDDFLSMDAAIDINEIKDFKLPPIPVLRPREFKDKDLNFADPAPNTPITPPRVIPPTGTEPEPPEFKLNLPSLANTEKKVSDYNDVRGLGNRALVSGLLARNIGDAIELRLKDPMVNVPDKAGVMQLVAGNQPKVGAGWASQIPAEPKTDAEKKEVFFQGWYGQLANNESKDLTAFWTGVKEAGLSEAEIDEIFTYFDQRTKYELRTDAKNKGGGDWSSRRSPEELRKFLGLEG